MNIVDVLLRAASVAIVLFLVHQIFLSKNGSEKHRQGGVITMVIGLIIVVLITIRGAQQETMSTLYAVHLLFGGPFILCLFLTGWFGWKTKSNKKLAWFHRLLGRTTGVLLILTLIVGVWSRLSH